MGTSLAARNATESPLAALVHGAAARLAASMPQHFTPERMAQVLSIIAYRTPRLAQCDPESVVTSIIHAGSCDADLTPGKNEGCLVPRKNRKTNTYECQFQPMYKLFEKHAVAAGAVRYIQPREVYEADEFQVWHEDERTHFKHVEAHRANDRGRVTHYYAVAKMADGSPMIEVMTADQVEAIHRRSESYRYAQMDRKPEEGPWATDYDAMGRKTVIRKLCKSLPRVAANNGQAAALDRLQAAIDHDNRQYEEAPALAPPKVDNGSGFGHGMYASPEQSAEFERKLKGFLVGVNDRWLNALGELCRGDIPKCVKELNEYQADNHLIKWGVETGRLDPSIVPEDVKIRQRYRYTAVIYFRSKEDQGALGRELRDYADRHWHRQLEALARKCPEYAREIAERWGVGELAPAEPEPGPLSDPEVDGDPDVDYERTGDAIDDDEAGSRG